MSTPKTPGPSTTTVIQTAMQEKPVGAFAFLKRQAQQSLAFGTLIVLVVVGRKAKAPEASGEMID